MTRSAVALHRDHRLARQIGAAAVALALHAGSEAAEPSARAREACPDVTGTYRVEGSGSAQGDAIKALRILSAGFIGSQVRVSGPAEDRLGLWVRSGSTGPLPSQPTLVLQNGTDYVCKDGRIVIASGVEASRRTDQTWLEGQSTVRLARSGRGGLAIEVLFKGRQRSTLYSYDSARVSIPLPGTGQTLSEALRWPDASEPETTAQPAPPPPEPKAVVSARRLLDSKVLGPVILGGLRPSGDAVAATLKVLRSEDAVRLEDRLRAAGIAYQVKVSPVWSNNAYHMEILVWPEGGGPGNAWRPSVHRVEQELRKMANPMVDVAKVETSGDAYLATLKLLGQETPENVIARLRANSSLFSEIALVNESVSLAAPKVRETQLRLRVR